ncbi:MAG: carboxylate-amine ligase [Ktedonobacteraceae bacterium]|nr:carboxylate-amine ligase [Ktedonobacteraceae bacterium]
MADQFTLGIEEEFQLVRQKSGELCSCAQSILDKGAPYFEEKIKPEMLQSTVEFVSDVLPDMAAARKELYSARALLSQLVNEEGMALISAGTHPSASWREQERTANERYIELEEEYQDVGRSILIFGLHVHVAVPEKELAIKIMNQVRSWLPHLVALSSNSPFWNGRMTGIKSYRSVVWKRFPRSGMPDTFASWGQFDRYVQDLVEMQCIDNGKKIWWDMRPHAFFDTLEFRICDMPSTLEDTLGIAAFCQALVAKLAYLNERDKATPVMRRDYIEENKWRAMRYGLDAEVLDFEHLRRLSMRDALRETLDFVDDVVDDLGSRREINYVRALLDDPMGTGADRQMAVYQESNDPQKVTRFLMERTMEGVKKMSTNEGRKALRFRSRKPTQQVK